MMWRYRTYTRASKITYKSHHDLIENLNDVSYNLKILDNSSFDVSKHDYLILLFKTRVLVSGKN